MSKSINQSRWGQLTYPRATVSLRKLPLGRVPPGYLKSISDLTIQGMMKQTGMLILLLAVACIPGYGRVLVLCALILAACGSPAWTLKSLIAGVLVTFMNPAFVGTTYAGSSGNLLITALKWILLFVAIGRSFLSPVEQTQVYSRLLTYWSLIGSVLVMNSIFVSTYPSISGFKTISFSLGILAIIRLALLTSNRILEMTLFVASLGVAVLVTSIPLLGLAIGRSLSGVGFNGVLNHPQALGIFLVMTGSAAFFVALKVPRLSRVLIVLGLAEWFMIAPTKARTAMLAVVIGGIVFCVESILEKRNNSPARYYFLVGLSMAIPGLMIVIMTFPSVTANVASFLQKGHDESIDSLGDPYSVMMNSSRGVQIEETLAAAERHPFVGLGFGVDENLSFRTGDSNSWRGIPLTAPVEQGFLPIATVAQIGLVGAAFLLPFLLSIYGYARSDSAASAGLFAAVLGVNMGETIFYSIGGLGVLMWIVLILFALSGNKLRVPTGGNYK